MTDEPRSPTDEELAEIFARSDEVAAAAEKARLEESRNFVLYEHADWRFDQSQGKYWDVRFGLLCPEKTVDSYVPRNMWRWVDPPPQPRNENGRPIGRPAQPKQVPASQDIREPARGLTVHSATWWPGKPRIIEGVYIDGAGAHEHAGRHTYNLYRPPVILRDAGRGGVQPWITHVQRMFPNRAESEWLFNYLAHMLQRPHEKPAGGVVLSGEQGTGKDALLFPVKAAVGYQNVRNIQPDELFNKFNGFVQSVMLVVDEARTHSDDHKATSMYNILKPLAVAPPDWLQVDGKYKEPYYVPNVCRLFITTNEVDGLFIPPDDRRLAVLHTDVSKDDELPRLREYWRWVKHKPNVAAVQRWLMDRDINGWDHNAEPPKTSMHAEIVESWMLPEDHPLAVAIERLGNPDVLFTRQLHELAYKWTFDGQKELSKALHPRRLSRDIKKLGYVKVPHNEDGAKSWKVDGYQCKAAYRRKAITLLEAHKRLRTLIEEMAAADGAAKEGPR